MSYRLERKPGAELSAERTRSKRTARVDEALGLHQRSRSIRIVEVTSEVGLIRQVKRLEDELEVPTLTHPDVLGNTHIHLEERIASNGVITSLMARSRSQTIERSHVAADCGVVCRIRIGHDHWPGIAAPACQHIETRPQIIGARRAIRNDWRHLESQGQRNDEVASGLPDSTPHPMARERV